MAPITSSRKSRLFASDSLLVMFTSSCPSTANVLRACRFSSTERSLYVSASCGARGKREMRKCVFACMRVRTHRGQVWVRAQGRDVEAVVEAAVAHVVPDGGDAERENVDGPQRLAGVCRGQHEVPHVHDRHGVVHVVVGHVVVPIQNALGEVPALDLPDAEAAEGAQIVHDGRRDHSQLPRVGEGDMPA